MKYLLNEINYYLSLFIILNYKLLFIICFMKQIINNLTILKFGYTSNQGNIAQESISKERT